ncbi:serine/Threonine kinase family catalytic domain protein isoform X2 [Wolffia australiana]
MMIPPANLLLIFFSCSSLLVAMATPPDQCLPASCGTGPNASFPFWIDDGIHPSTCGFPSFKLSCSNSTSILRIFGRDYIVKNISYPNQTMIVSPRFSCLPPRQNFSLEGTPFSLLPGPSTSFFYFNCSPNAVLNDYKRIPCPQGVSFFGWHPLGESQPCDWNVSLPDAFRLGSDVGFSLRWRAVSCEGCLRSGGLCRYNEQNSRFGCLCDSGLAIDVCKRRNSKMKILIGVAAGSGGVLLACLFCLLFRRKKSKALNNSSKLLSWAPSSDTSSRKDLEGDSDLISGTPFFRYEELQNATSGFSSSNELGEGGFGIVYKGKLKDGRMVAVKRLFENNFKRVEQFMNEVVILNRLRHPNLVNLYGCTSRHSRELLLVYEYVPNGTVADHLHGDLASQQVLTWPLRLTIATETASAIAYLHAAEPPIIHRDIKTNNILLDVDFHVKVADFGLSRLYPIAATHVSTAPQGTPGYVDPEYHRFYQLTDKSDVYSFGVVLVELISSLPAVDLGRRRAEVNLSSMAVERIQNGRLDELVDPRLGFEHDPNVRRSIEAVAELAFRCLQDEKEMRPTMEDALEVLFSAQDNRRVSEDSAVGPRKTEEMVLLKGPGPPLTPSSIMDAWVSRATTPAASG